MHHKLQVSVCTIIPIAQNQITDISHHRLRLVGDFRIQFYSLGHFVKVNLCSKYCEGSKKPYSLNLTKFLLSVFRAD